MSYLSFMKENKSPVIVAEAGNNAEGNINIAIELLERAKECGADMVKFQAGTADGFARNAEDTPRYKKYELGKEGYDRLVKRGIELDIPVFFSVWSEEFEYLMELPYRKIAARQCQQDYINRWAMNTTFISIPTTKRCCDLTIPKGVIMHTVSQYPATEPFLIRIPYIYDYFKLPVGYSDHCLGISACVDAWRYYKVFAIEKHFTLDHNTVGIRDHLLSADPEEMKQLIQEVKG